MSKKTTAYFESPTPIVLGATAFKEANTGPGQAAYLLAPGGTQTPPMDQLSYAFRKPVLIDEIRFSITGGDIPRANLGAFVYVKLSLGQMYLMRDPVPVASLASFMSIDDEEYPGESYGLGINSVSTYRWRLPQPLYIEAGQYLLPVFSRAVNDPFPNETAIIPFISYAGRTVPPQAPRPKVIAVPYVAPFVTPLNPSGRYVQSNERHLFNPFDKPLQIQRMTGRHYYYGLQAPGVYNFVRLYTGITPGPTNTHLTNVSVRLNDSWGGKMVNNFVGPSDTWDLQRMGWTVDTAMPAKGQYEAQVWNIQADSQVQLAMIGTREEKI
jgi:hypothetical protein